MESPNISLVTIKRKEVGEEAFVPEVAEQSTRRKRKAAAVGGDIGDINLFMDHAKRAIDDVRLSSRMPGEIRDKFYHFGQRIAEEIREIHDPIQQKYLMFKINELIYDQATSAQSQTLAEVTGTVYSNML